jgi:hypothetical protein
MKLQHLAIGDRFEYNGKIFVKTGPLTAASEEGGQQIIPRYAVLKPLNPPPREEKPSLRRKLDEKTVQAAFDDFYQACSTLVDDSALPALLEARQRFLERLK